jgi:hypothetical protein
LKPPKVAAESSYHHLIEEMALAGITSRIPVAKPVERDLGALMEVEREIVRSSVRSLLNPDYIDFAAEQLSATQQVFGGPTPDRARARQDLLRYRAMLFRVLGLSEGVTSIDSETLARVMVATTPYLRSILAFPAERSGAFVNHLTLECIPRLMVALHTMMALALDAGMTEITFQSVSAVFGRDRRLLGLLALLDRGVSWHSDIAAPLEFPGDSETRARYLRILRRLVRGGRAADGAALGEILCEHLPDEGLDRVVFLRNLADRVANRLAGVTQARRQGRGPKLAIRAEVYHFVLSRLSDEVLMGLAELHAAKVSPVKKRDRPGGKET